MARMTRACSVKLIPMLYPGGLSVDDDEHQVTVTGQARHRAGVAADGDAVAPSLTRSGPPLTRPVLLRTLNTRGCGRQVVAVGGAPYRRPGG